MPRLFGTDGARGLANADITPELALGLSLSAAREVLSSADASGPSVPAASAAEDPEHSVRAHAIVGRDPRASGEFLSAATVAGLASAGLDVYDAGVLPTPAIAFLTKTTHASLGAMLSASHNPMPDNGIKFFAEGGYKLPDEMEDRIEAGMGEQWDRPTGARVGRVLPYERGADAYVEHLLAALPNRLDGLHVVIDAANGAASEVGPRAFREAGAKVTVIGNAPDGLNINDGCGSTHLGPLQAAVPAYGADFGVAFDGDADRCLAVDAEGNEVTGDQVMALLALSLKDRGALANDTLVATVMSNQGLVQAMEAAGIQVVRSKVGDRYVLEDMRAGGHTLGGEQSGHVILLDHGTTGDGVLTGLMLAARVAETRTPLAELAACMQLLPQTLINVQGVDKERLEGDPTVAAAVAEVEAELGAGGRVLLRKSGTEPVVRVMVEAPTQDLAAARAEQLADVVRSALAL
ncbi:phosphoglucosamine mutase [Kytococcus schroeteri]|uniref:phosphoglucosamine mutase n=1 Tax=Kytococcus schroeteri TaxID=138300 RepID=UPI0035E4DC5D